MLTLVTDILPLKMPISGLRGVVYSKSPNVPYAYNAKSGNVWKLTQHVPAGVPPSTELKSCR
jgi:hypothetical protein